MIDPRLPLAELHLHLYGTIRADDYLERLGARAAAIDWGFYEKTYERAYGDRPPVRDILERHQAGDPDAASAFRDLFVFGNADAGNFQRFQAKFNLLINGSELMNAAAGLHADPVPPVAEEIDFFVTRMLDDQRRQGIGYAEQRMLFGASFPIDVMRRLSSSILERYAAATRDGFTARLALGLPRADPWPCFELVKELALGPYGEYVTGVDFCNVEEGFPPKHKREFFAAVHDWNERHPERALAILYHVGESFTDKSLESAVRWVHEAAEFGAHRLGHAIALGIDPAVYGAHERHESVDERLDQIDYDLAHADGLRVARRSRRCKCTAQANATNCAHARPTRASRIAMTTPASPRCARARTMRWHAFVERARSSRYVRLRTCASAASPTRCIIRYTVSSTPACRSWSPATIRASSTRPCATSSTG